ncbi:MAG: NAD(P)-dependent oxidoreductase [Flavobacteriales bacterium]
MAQKKILFIDCVHAVLQQRMETLGFACELRYNATQEELMNDGAEYCGIVIRSRITLDKTFIDAFPNLKFIARSGSGLENMDVPYIESKGIAIFNSPEGNRDAVGEHVIGMLLTLFNRLRQADNEVREGLWRREENRGIELREKTFAIIGYGVMGSGLAEKLIGFGCKIIAHDKYKSGFGNDYVKEVSLQEIFEQADIVSIHLPLNAETEFYVNYEFISKFRKPFYFINTSRGRNVNTSAIFEALLDDKLLGACIDVLEYEKASLEGPDFSEIPLDLHYLMFADNVILTPHIAGWTHESYYKLSSVLADKIEHWKNRDCGDGLNTK